MHKLQKLAREKGIELSKVGFGCWAIGGEFYLFGKYDGWGNIDDDESISAIREGIDLGVNFFDTADVYGTGHSERVLGKAIKGIRDQVCIATKFGYVYDENTKEVSGEDYTPKYIERALRASLKRLNTDYIDLYQLHVGAIADEAIPPMVEKLESLVKEGLILGYGWSTYDEEAARKIAAYPNAVAVQHSMNLFGGNKKIVDIAEENNIASLNNSPLAMGLLSGKYTKETTIDGNDVRNTGFDWVRYFDNGVPKEEYLNKLTAIKEILTSDGRSLVQGALGYLIGTSDNNIPIPGFKNIRQARENADVLRFGALKKAQIEEINQLI